MRTTSALVFWTLAAPVLVHAQTLDPVESTVSVDTCHPTCRQGFVCHDGECVSACNPACPEGTTCTAAGTCAPSAVPAQPAPVVAPPPAATRRPLARRVRLDVYATTRVGGGYSVEGGDLHTMEPGFGVGFRVEIPAGRFFALGPAFQFVSLLDDPDDDRYALFAPGLWFKARRVFETRAGGIEIYLGIPVGFSGLRYPRDGGEEGGGYDFDRGAHVGALAGAQFFFGPFGILVEAGFHRDFVFAPDAGRREYTQLQPTLNFGFAFAL